MSRELFTMRKVPHSFVRMPTRAARIIIYVFIYIVAENIRHVSKARACMRYSTYVVIEIFAGRCVLCIYVYLRYMEEILTS